MPPVYRGHFGKPQAERLLWRAGFGPRPGEAERLAKLGLEGAVHALMRPGRDRLKGPRPHDDRGRKLSPYDRWGHDQLWWLDRMVRTTKPLHERMTLVWHDWFATSRDGVGPAKLMLRQNQLFRRVGLSSFPGLLMEVTRDPAMLLWLSGVDNEKGSPNENYARELMELFTLGADRGAYTEHDVREQARALTGFRYTWSNKLGPVRFRFDAKRHDTGSKRIFGKRGHFDWRDSCRLCVHHRKHPSFFVTKLWGYFVPVPPSAGDASLARAALRPQRLRGRPGRRRDPAPPRALHRAAHGQVAGALPRRPAARARPRDRHRGLDLAAPARRPAALLPAERRRLGRLALARHGHLPRTLGDRGLRDPAEGVEGVGQARPGPGRQARRTAPAQCSGSRRSPGRRRPRFRTSPSALSTTPIPTGRRSSTRR